MKVVPVNLAWGIQTGATRYVEHTSVLSRTVMIVLSYLVLSLGCAGAYLGGLLGAKQPG